jgi:hypothetical protein
LRRSTATPASSACPAATRSSPLDGEDLRRAVFPHRDVALRKALQLLLKYARQEAHDAGRSRFQTHEWVEVNRFLGGERSRSAPPLVAPEIVLGHPSFQPVFAIGADEKRYVNALRPRYVIENKTTDTTVRDLTTGIRTRDGREFDFDVFRAPALRAGETALVDNVEVSHEYLAGLHESAVGTALIYWVRFTAPDGIRWCVSYDTASRDHDVDDE